LRILDEGIFDVVWTDDGWQTKHSTASRSIGNAGAYADVAPAAGKKELEWTLHWPESDGWLGYNVKVTVEDA
jgi:glucoamylase